MTDILRRITEILNSLLNLFTSWGHKEYRGITEIAKRLGKSENFVRDLIVRKKDPLPVKVMGREYWITEKALQRWLENGG